MLIKVSKDFSPCPGPRYPGEGKYSGEEFRKQHLVPAVWKAMKDNSTLTVDLDGAAGYATSFLEEAFGGLIREEHFLYQDIKKHLAFVSREESHLIREIEGYLEEAHEKKNIS